MVTLDSLPTSAVGGRRALAAGVFALCVLSGLGGWALAQRTASSSSGTVTGTVVDLSGNGGKACVSVDGQDRCGALVVPPGATPPRMGQVVRVYITDVGGTEFLILPPSVG
jgi:hypothetical protein